MEKSINQPYGSEDFQINWKIAYELIDNKSDPLSKCISDLMVHLKNRIGNTKPSIPSYSLMSAICLLMTHSEDVEKERLHKQIVKVFVLYSVLSSHSHKENEAALLSKNINEELLSRILEQSDDSRKILANAFSFSSACNFTVEVELYRVQSFWNSLVAFSTSEYYPEYTQIPSSITRSIDEVCHRLQATNMDIDVTVSKLSENEIRFQKLSDTNFCAERTPNTLTPELIGQIRQLMEPDIDEDRLRPVWYGTSRAATGYLVSEQGDSGLPVKNYGAKFDRHKSHFGVCLVEIPKTTITKTTIGEQLRKLITRVPTKLKQAQVKAVYEFSTKEDFKIFLKEENVQKKEKPHRTGLVFLHGFNNTFLDAVEVAAEMAESIKHKGHVAIFSWASRDNILRYGDDRKDITRNKESLREFLEVFANECELDSVDIIVHSLGNTLFIRSLEELADSGIKFSKIILAAPDIYTTEYKSLAQRYSLVGEHVTLYNSHDDHALFAGTMRDGRPRAGTAPPIETFGWIDSIETGQTDTSRLGHSYIYDSPTIKSDVAQIRNGSIDPDTRPNIFRANSAFEVDYWCFSR